MKIEKIISVFSILYTVLVIFGLLFNILFYQRFNLDITQYIELSESLILFIPALPGLLIFFPLMLIAFETLKPNAIVAKIDEGSIYANIFDAKALKKRSIKIITLTSLIILLLLLMFSILLASQGLLRGFFICAFVFVFLYLPLPLRLLYPVLSNVWKIPTYIPLVFYVGLIFLLAIFWRVDSKYYRVMNGIRNPELKVLFNDGKSVETDSLRHFIGKTNGFIFIYNEREKETVVIPVNDIRNLVFKAKY